MLGSSPVLITGSEGLIGRVLTQYLKSHHIPVIQIDKRLPVHHPGKGDICNSAWLSQFVANCQGIVHLAGVSRVVWGEQQPKLCWQVNVEATRHLLELALAQPRQPWVIYASSREVYGQQTLLPVTEEATLAPLNVYARSKVAAEELIRAYQSRGLRAAILRFSSVYGHPADYTDRVVPAFCLNAIHQQPLRIDGLQNTFDFTHVKDVVNGIFRTMQLLATYSNTLPFLHLTTGKGTTLLQLVDIIERTLGKKVSYVEAPKRHYDVHTFWGDPKQAKHWLMWEAKIDIAQGVANLLHAYQQTHSLRIAL